MEGISFEILACIAVSGNFLETFEGGVIILPSAGADDGRLPQSRNCAERKYQI
jgi:hypothetical protein